MQGDNSYSARIGLEGADTVEEQLATLGASGETAIARIKAAADATAEAAGGGIASLASAAETVTGAIGTVGASIQAFGAEAGRTFSEVGAAVGEVTESFGGLEGILHELGPEFAVLGAASVPVALFAIANSAAEATRELVNISAALGVSTDDFEALRYAAGQTGVDTDKFATHLTKMVAVIGTAQEAFDKAAAGADAYNEKVAILADKQDLAAQSVARAAEAGALGIEKLNQGLAKDQLAATEASEAQSRLGGVVTAATRAHEAFANATAKVSQAQQKIVDDQAAIQQAYEAQYLASEKALIAEKEHALELDNLARAALDSVSPLDKFLQSIGVVGDGAKGSANDILKIVDGLKALNDPAKAGALELKLFGRGWVDLAPFVAVGADAVKAAEEQFERSGLGIGVAQKLMSTAYESSWNKLKSFLGAIKDQVGDILSQIFVPGMEAMANFIADNREVITSITQSYVDTAIPVLKAFGAAVGIAFDLVVRAAKLAMPVFGWVAQLINATFGTQVTGGMLAWGAAFVAIIGYVSQFKIVLAAINPILKLISFSPWITAIALVVIAADQLYEHWDEIVAKVKSTWKSLEGDFSVDDSAIVTVLKGIVWWLDDVGAGIKNIITLAKAMAAAFGSAQAAAPEAATGGAGHAGGGPVYGPGTATSDSVPIRASVGEFVMSARAVAHYGLDVMAAINSLRLAAPGFALGGIVGGLSPAPLRFAGGGAVGATQSPNRPFNLVIGGETFARLLAPSDVADKMVTFARGRSLRSAGKKPGWYGGG